ncbi:GIN domain-containing protein [Pedobacter sp. Leaf132]|uniref:GIN domain-containing protein n=1 Tax=Pedobacter sp. Leaf132 TaxID=2876557 RepID=UPI001E51DDB6|nr:DUF2807 domain-containing protein [Pedobacter sp. Leaf132]
MKTSIKTLFATSLTVITLTTSVFSTSLMANEKKPVTTVSAPSNFKRISVQGNVEIKIVQRKSEAVTYAEDNLGKAKITQEGDLLKITSSDKEVSKITVYVADIYRIEAADNAVVKTEGKIKAKFLQVFLKGNAHAVINSSTEGLYTVIKDDADLKLSGATDNHTVIMGDTQKLTMDRFAALKTNIQSTEDMGAITETVAVIK